MKLKKILLACVLAFSVCAFAENKEVKPLVKAILTHQISDGGIRMLTTDNTVWINPYFTNLALYSLLNATQDDPKLLDEVLKTTEKWLNWYAENQLPNGAICDFRGYLDNYTTTNTYDSTDSYAATYIVLVDLYMQLSKKSLTPKVTHSVMQAYKIMIATMQEDGLTWAHPDYKVKYLMDNIEVNQGLIAAILLAKKLDDKELELDAKARLKLNTTSLDKFIVPNEAYLAWAIETDDIMHHGFKVFYPDYLANSFACSMLNGLAPRYWDNLSDFSEIFAKELCSRSYVAALRFNDTKTSTAIFSAMQKKFTENEGNLGAIRLDILNLMLGIALEDANYWPATQELNISSELR